MVIEHMTPTAFAGKARRLYSYALGGLLASGEIVEDDALTRRLVVSRCAEHVASLSARLGWPNVSKVSDLRASVALAWILEPGR